MSGFSSIAERLLFKCDGLITAENIEALGFENIRSCGISTHKVRCILNFCQMVVETPQFFTVLADHSDNEILKALIAFQGIGSWTAKMYLIFVLNRPSVIPYEDGAFLQAYRWLYKTEETSSASIQSRCKAWHPYESFGARYLYQLLDYGITKYASLAEAETLWTPFDLSVFWGTVYYNEAII